LEGIALGCFFGLGFESCFGLRLFLWALAAEPSKWGAKSEGFGTFSPVSALGFVLSAFFGMLLEVSASRRKNQRFIAS
jgi:hypothetical protein